MVVRVMILRPQSVSLTLFLYPPRLFPKPSYSSLTFSSFSSSSSSPIPYGPSLQKGYKPSKSQHPRPQETAKTDDPSSLFDDDNFTRIFDIAALRVPADQCFALETRLRGHLLNWPRIRNIARVPGDEIEVDFKDFVKSNQTPNSEDEGLVSLNRRIYGKAEGDGEHLSPVLYRDKLVHTFNSRGFLNFRNVAKMSRPKKSKKKEEEKGGRREKKGIGKNELYVVEVEEGDEGFEGEDLSGLLGEDFKGKKWRGSTRLLLLDERYSCKAVDEMPEAIQAVFIAGPSQSTPSAIELVQCKLTLFYTYWQMNEVLEALLPKGLIVPSAFETVGHIAHLNLRDEHNPYKKLIGKVVLDKNKPKIQAVVNKIDLIHNEYRTMQLEVLAGTHNLTTTIVENGLRFQVDLETVYWNSKLATERQRLINCFTESDIVCDVFAGVGPIAIAAAKRVKRVYANDLNPQATDFLQRNSVLNKVERKVEVFNMDGRRFVDTVFASSKAPPITQVVMNLPKDAAEYLDAFRGLFRRCSAEKEYTLPKIHVYGFSKAPDPEFDFQERIRIALSEAAFEIGVHRVRLVAPGKWMLCASFTLPARVANAKYI